MVDINNKREKEKKTLRVMIEVYCRGSSRRKAEQAAAEQALKKLELE